MQFAICGRNYNIVKFLLENDMMPHYHIQHRTTALTLASKRRCTDIVKLLLKTRFDVSARLQGKSAIQLVARYDYAEVIALLLDAGAEVGLSDLLDVTCSGSTAAVSLRIDKGRIYETRLIFQKKHRFILQSAMIIQRSSVSFSNLVQKLK